MKKTLKGSYVDVGKKYRFSNEDFQGKPMEFEQISPQSCSIGILREGLGFHEQISGFCKMKLTVIITSSCLTSFVVH